MLLKKISLILVSILTLFSLNACKSEVDLNPNFTYNGLREVTRTSIYSNFINGKEFIGSQFKIYTEEDIVGQGSGMKLKRRFINKNNSGYLSKTLSWELAYMTPIEYEIKDHKMYAVEGFNDFTKTVIPNLHLPSRYEKELSNPVFPAQFAQDLKLEWDLTHILKGKIPLLANVTHLVPQKKFGLVNIDSVISLRVEPMGDIDCLRYNVHYTKTLKRNALIYEQMRAQMKPKGEEYDVFKFKEGTGIGRLTVWIDISSSRICKMSLNERQTNVIVHNETAETQEVLSHRFNETIYAYPEVKK